MRVQKVKIDGADDQVRSNNSAFRDNIYAGVLGEALCVKVDQIISFFFFSHAPTATFVYSMKYVLW